MKCKSSNIPCRLKICLFNGECVVTYKGAGLALPPKRERKKHPSYLRKIRWNTREDECFYCLSPLHVGARTRDHVIPKSKGGTLEEWNRVWACRECNGEKGNYSVDEWLKMVKGTIHEKQGIRIRQLEKMISIISNASGELKTMKDENLDAMPIGFPTHTKDITGKLICLGDIVDYDFKDDDSCPFEVVFEDNAFRKKYKKWDKTLVKPLLEFGYAANKMRLKIVKSST